MCRTFAVLVPKKYENNVKIDKFHLNIWYLDSAEVYVDVGCLFKVDDPNINKINFTILTPFLTERVDDLREKLINKEILQLIFNSIASMDGDNYVKTDSDEFYLVKSRPDVEDEGSKIKVKVSIKDTDKEHYFRIRCRIKTNNGKSYNEKNKLFMKRRDYNLLNEYLYFDIRVNENRLMPDIDLDEYILCKITKIYIFLVVPDHYKPGIDISKDLKNSRFLESEHGLWHKYLGALDKTKNRFLVYFWKISSNGSTNSSNTTVNITILFEKLISSTKIIIAVILIVFHSDIANLIYIYTHNSFQWYLLVILLSGFVILCILASNHIQLRSKV